MTDKKQKAFFLYRMIESSKGLKLDQPRMLSSFYCTLIFILLAMDLVGLLFYWKTNARIEAMQQHPFTNSIDGSIKRASEEHQKYEQKAREIIRE